MSLVTVLRSCVVSWSLRFDWSIAVSSDRRPVTLQDAIRHLSETYPIRMGSSKRWRRPRLTTANPDDQARRKRLSKGRKSFEKLASIAQRKSDADGRKDTQ